MDGISVGGGGRGREFVTKWSTMAGLISHTNCESRDELLHSRQLKLIAYREPVSVHVHFTKLKRLYTTSKVPKYDNCSFSNTLNS